MYFVFITCFSIPILIDRKQIILNSVSAQSHSFGVTVIFTLAFDCINKTYSIKESKVVDESFSTQQPTTVRDLEQICGLNKYKTQIRWMVDDKIVASSVVDSMCSYY